MISTQRMYVTAAKPRWKHTDTARSVITALCLLLIMSPAATAGAGTQSAADHWRALTRIDADAAYTLLENNHPGAVSEVGDTLFKTMLAAAHTKALARAADVTNYEGYVATLGEFAATMSDGHVWSHPRFLPRSVYWAGLIAARRGSSWVVANENPDITGAPLTGARIVSCDGQSADARAVEVLHFLADPSIEASQVIKGGWLLVDVGNPFLPRSRGCIFERDGTEVSVTLHWQPIDRNTLFSKYWKNPYGKAGYGLRQSGAGYWIAIEELSPPAQAVIDAVKAQEDKVRSAPYAVVDLRGNSGGDDAYGRALADALYGSNYVTAMLGPNDNGAGDCTVFRASPDNIAAIAASAADFRTTGDVAGAEGYAVAVTRMKAAADTGHALSGSLTCPARPSSSPRIATSLMRGKVFVLTDPLCFSSCIQTVGYFRKLGATQLGQATGADTHYSEVREIVLPSGLSTFSTLTALMPDEPLRLGPYLPKSEYVGDIADTASLEKWVADSVVNVTGE